MLLCVEGARREALRDALGARPVLKRQIECLDRGLGGARQLPRAALEREAVADREDALGRQGDLVVLCQQQSGRGQRVAVQASERDQQVVAGATVKPGQRQALIEPREALLRTEVRIGIEGELLAAGAMDEADVGVERLAVAAAGVSAARSRRGERQVGQRGPARAHRLDRGERLLVLGRPEVGDQQRKPARLLEVRLARHLSVEAGRIVAQRLKAGARKADLRRQAPSVGGGAKARRERCAVAVVV